MFSYVLAGLIAVSSLVIPSQKEQGLLEVIVTYYDNQEIKVGENIVVEAIQDGEVVKQSTTNENSVAFLSLPLGIYNIHADFNQNYNCSFNDRLVKSEFSYLQLICQARPKLYMPIIEGD